MIAAELGRGCSVERALPYRAEQLFDLVADVERYPEFVPGWTAARISERGQDFYCTEQTVGFGPIRLTFGTETHLLPPHRIEVSSNDSRFVDFRLAWTFEPRPDEHCRMRLTVAVRFRSRLMQLAADHALAGLAEQTFAAFKARAFKCYGPLVRA